jgi:hypothetical protein
LSLSGFDDLAVGSHDLTAIFRSEEYGVIFAHHFLNRLPQQTRTGGVDHEVAPLEILDKDRIDRAFRDPLEKG